MMRKAAGLVLGSLARRAGCELVPHWRLERLGLARHLTALFETYGVDVVLDVGANKGQYYDFLRREVGYVGHVVSFEPIKSLATGLKDRARADPKWRVYNCALGRQRGVLGLNVMQGDELSSFRTPDASQVPEYSNWNTVVRVEEVPVQTLDDIWPDVKADLGCTRPYLKLDTQGFDAEVLAGGSTSLPAMVGLQSEVHVLRLYANTPRHLEEIAHLESLGFGITGTFVVSADAHLRAIELDCVMVNENLC